MELFNPNSAINFMGLRRWTACFSLLIFILSLGSLLTKGLVWGLDFTGGMQVEVSYTHPADLSDIRMRLSGADFQEAQVMAYGTSQHVLISVSPHVYKAKGQLSDQLIAALPGATVERVDVVGPQVGQELATKGALAVLVSLILTLIYIAMRFEFRLGVSAIIALIHDPVLILGVFSFFGVEFDLKALAGLLAVIGYSLNDTIVVFDRVRENFIKMRRLSALDIMNQSINQTLSRTIMTSLLTLFVVLSLLIYGGAAIYSFALALAIGIVIGTYSSIYVAGALAIAMGLDRQDFVKVSKQLIDDRP